MCNCNACNPFYDTIDEGAKAFSMAELFLSMFNLLFALHIYLEVVFPITVVGFHFLSMKIVFIFAIILISTLIIQSFLGFLLYILGWKLRNVLVCVLWIISTIPNIVLPWLILIVGSCDSIFQKLVADSSAPIRKEVDVEIENIKNVEVITEPCMTTPGSCNLAGEYEDDYYDTEVAVAHSHSLSHSSSAESIPFPEGRHLHCGYWSPLFLYLLYPIYGIWIMIAFIQWTRSEGITATFDIRNVVAPSSEEDVEAAEEKSKNLNKSQRIIHVEKSEVIIYKRHTIPMEKSEVNANKSQHMLEEEKSKVSANKSERAVQVEKSGTKANKSQRILDIEKSGVNENKSDRALEVEKFGANTNKSEQVLKVEKPGVNANKSQRALQVEKSEVNTDKSRRALEMEKSGVNANEGQLAMEGMKSEVNTDKSQQTLKAKKSGMNTDKSQQTLKAEKSGVITNNSQQTLALEDSRADKNEGILALEVEEPVTTTTVNEDIDFGLTELLRYSLSSPDFHSICRIPGSNVDSASSLDRIEK